MKLVSIQIFPNGHSGWQSDLLKFGDNITQIFGPNGCGKTPIVQSIAYCLGYQGIFRKDIYERCDHAILVVKTLKGNLKLKRVYNRSFLDIEVTEPSGARQRFYDEKDYSAFLFKWLDLPISNLVTTNNKLTSPYLTTMLPIFYLDQDEGYAGFYCPKNNFIKDQFSEMMRMLFRLPAKNSFDAKKDKILAKENLDYLDKKVEIQSRRVEKAKQATAFISKSSDELTAEIRILETELEKLKSAGATHDDSIKVLDRLISSHNSTILDLTQAIAEIEKRSKGIDQIIHEINTEIDTLNLNEEARRVFLSFDEICTAAHCQLFSASSDAYSKNLLYLKDQIKDLERNTAVERIKAEQLIQQKRNLENIVQSIEYERNAVLEKSEMSALVDAISELKNQIFQYQNQRSEIEELEELKSIHFKIISERNDALEKYLSYSTDRSLIPGLVKLKAELRQFFLDYLDHLHTNNISRDITFKDDFAPFLGVEPISQLKGSTKVRAVLAYHAALLELIAKNDNFSFRFLILDTPKQHEIHNDDLDRYINALKKLCLQFDMQIVFSTTEYHYKGDELDAEWNPQYPGEKQKMFLESSQV